MSLRPPRAFLALLAGPALVVATAAGAGAAELGPNGATLELNSVSRTGGHLVVAFTITNHTTAPYVTFGTAAITGPDVPGAVLVSVLNPATRAVGGLLGNKDACRCSALPSSLAPGQAVTAAVEVADPGGERVDLLFNAFHPVVGVPVQGTGTAATGLATPQPRTLALQARSKEQAARSTGGRIDLETDVLFAFDSAKITTRGKASVQAAAKKLGAQSKRRLAIYGHTDGKGTPAYNLALSTRRAEAVRAALAPLLGSGWSFEVKGLGETEPISLEKTKDGADYPAGRALNRRVELSLLG